MLKGECYSNLLFKMNLKSTKCLPPETVKQQLMAEQWINDLSFVYTYTCLSLLLMNHSSALVIALIRSASGIYSSPIIIYKLSMETSLQNIHYVWELPISIKRQGKLELNLRSMNMQHVRIFIKISIHICNLSPTKSCIPQYR